MPASDKRPADQSVSAPLCGVLVVDKPAGISSMGVVARVRRRAGRAKTGHAGTLDPLATGVLVLAIGRATRSIERLMKTDKRYTTVVDLSAFTMTDDLESDREEVVVDDPPGLDAIEAALPAFIGDILQRPPAFSAIKVDGQRAYTKARKGQEVVIPPRPVTIHDIRVLAYEWPEVELGIHCEKGVYVRSLARDIGTALGTGGHCVALRRTAVGPFTEDMAIQLDDIPDPLRMDDLIDLEKAMAMVGPVEPRG